MPAWAPCVDALSLRLQGSGPAGLTIRSHVIRSHVLLLENPSIASHEHPQIFSTPTSSNLICQHKLQRRNHLIAPWRRHTSSTDVAPIHPFDSKLLQLQHRACSLWMEQRVMVWVPRRGRLGGCLCAVPLCRQQAQSTTRLGQPAQIIVKCKMSPFCACTSLGCVSFVLTSKISSAVQSEEGGQGAHVHPSFGHLSRSAPFPLVQHRNLLDWNT